MIIMPANQPHAVRPSKIQMLLVMIRAQEPSTARKCADGASRHSALTPREDGNNPFDCEPRNEEPSQSGSVVVSTGNMEQANFTSSCTRSILLDGTAKSVIWSRQPRHTGCHGY
jgi:hypothetical protein